MANELRDSIKYLDSLQSITDVSYIFPSTQKTYKFDASLVTSYNVHIQWHTLVVDQITYDRSSLPVFDNSEVIGYYEGSTGTFQSTTGTIIIPSYMYDGKILPASDINVPVTVVNLRWEKADNTSYSHNIAYIQQWEPGVLIGDPQDGNGYEPIYGITSSLVLSAPARVVLDAPLELTAVSDIPINLGTDNPCSFYYLNGATPVLLGTALFSDATKSAILEYDTGSLSLTTYSIYAEFGGRREYSRTRSNTISVEIIEAIPLLTVFQTLNPSKATYYPNDVVKYSIGVIPDPAFPNPDNEPVENPLVMKTIDAFTPFTSSTFFTGNFINGVSTGTFTVIASMIDTLVLYTGTNYSIITSTQNSTSYTATILVTNTETVKTEWDYDVGLPYARGSASRTLQVGTTTVRTVLADVFPIVISQDISNTLAEDTFNISVSTPNRSYANNISIIAVNQATGSTSTIYSSNNSGTSSYVATLTNVLTTGTYTLYASYPGDIGNNIFYANRASESNTLTHIIRSGNILDAKFVFYSTSSYDVLRVWATTATTLTQIVSFYQDATLLGTSTWSRQLIDITQPVISIYRAGTTYGVANFAQNWTTNPGLAVGWSSPYKGMNSIEITKNSPSTPFGDGMKRGYPEPITLRYQDPFGGRWRSGYPTAKAVNKYSLFKYYDGTNYNLNNVVDYTLGGLSQDFVEQQNSATDVSAISDPITYTFEDWETGVYGYRDFNINEPFINSNTTFYNYLESRFGYAYMLEYLKTLTALDGQDFRLNNLIFNDRPKIYEKPPSYGPWPKYSSYASFVKGVDPTFPGYMGSPQMNPDNAYWTGIHWFWMSWGQADFAPIVVPEGRIIPPEYLTTPTYRQAVVESYGFGGDIGGSPYGGVVKYNIICKNVPDGTEFTYEQIGEIVESDLVAGPGLGGMTGTLVVNNNFATQEFCCINETTQAKIFKLRLRYKFTNQIVGMESISLVDESFANDTVRSWDRQGRGFITIGFKENQTYQDNGVYAPVVTLPITTSVSSIVRGNAFDVFLWMPTSTTWVSNPVYVSESGCYTGAGEVFSYLLNKIGVEYVPGLKTGYPYRIRYRLNLGPNYVQGTAYQYTDTYYTVHSVGFASGFGGARKRYRTELVKIRAFAKPLPPVSSGQTVRQTFYDIYKTDKIGDSRGYNVIGLNANTSTSYPSVSEYDPLRLYFTGPSGKEQHIDLVEYIGETEWMKPIENGNQSWSINLNSTSSSTLVPPSEARSKVKVWLYRFTPTIPQANTNFRTNINTINTVTQYWGDITQTALDLDPNNTIYPRPLPSFPDEYRWVPYYNSYVADYFRDKNFIGVEANNKTWPKSPNWYNAWDNYQYYGRKVWYSANASDPVENAKAEFYNDWFYTFTNPDAIIHTENVYTTTYETITTNDVQVATVLLPANTITTSTGLHASWPGTRSLAAVYGRYNPFDINVISPVSQIFLDVSYINSNNISSTATILYSTNKALLKVNILSEPFSLLFNTGTVTVYDLNSNVDLITLPVTNSESSAYIFANSLTNLTSAPFINLQARYNNPEYSLSLSDTLTIQAIKTPYTYESTFTSNVSVSDYIKTKTYSSIQTNAIRLSGNIDLTLPFFQGPSAATNSEYKIYLIFSVYMSGGIWIDNIVLNNNGDDFWRVIAPALGNQPINYRIQLSNKQMYNLDLESTQYRVSVRVVSQNYTLNGSKVFIAQNLTDNI